MAGAYQPRSLWEKRLAPTVLAVGLWRDRLWHLEAGQLCPPPPPRLLSGRLVPSFCWGQKLCGGFTHTLVCVFDGITLWFQIQYCVKL